MLPEFAVLPPGRTLIHSFLIDYTNEVEMSEDYVMPLKLPQNMAYDPSNLPVTRQCLRSGSEAIFADYHKLKRYETQSEFELGRAA